MSKKKVIEDLDNLLTLFKNKCSGSCASSYDSLNEFDKFSRSEAKEACKKEQAVAKGGSLSSDEFSTETNPNLLDLDILLEELRSSKFLGRIDLLDGRASNHNSSCSEELSDKQDSLLATDELDSLMESLTYLGANTPSKNKLTIPDPIHPSVSLSSGSKVFSCSTSSLAMPSKFTPDLMMMMMAGLNERTENEGVKLEQKDVCNACGKAVAGDVVSIMGKSWHPQHFVCIHCKEPIGDKNFFERSGKFYCEKDFHFLFTPKCAACNGPILDMCVTAVDKMWHPDHFVCHHCQKRIVDGDDFHEHNNEIYCRKDYCELVAPRCKRCKMAVVENFISAMNKFWHINCFVCFDCQKPMGADSVYEVDGYPYCCQHYHARKGSLCHTCKQPIIGSCVSAMMKKFHPEHFVCCFCQGKLTTGIFKECGEKPYCRHCYKRLFS